MKKNLIIPLGVCVLLITGGVLFAAEMNDLGARTPTIYFQGQLVDVQDLPFDGTVSVGVVMYETPAHMPSDPALYDETFSEVAVEHGYFRVALSPGDLSAYEEVYVDLWVDGSPFLESWPLRGNATATRAERSVEATQLSGSFVLADDQIPPHDAALISSGVLDRNRLPAIPGDRVGNGEFQLSQVPSIDASRVTTGTFGVDAFGRDVSADQFDRAGSVLPERLIPSQVIRAGDYAFSSGVAGHHTVAAPPSGFHPSQCTWMAGLNALPSPDISSGVDQIHVSIDGTTGLVTCTWATGSGTADRTCSANYLAICRK